MKCRRIRRDAFKRWLESFPAKQRICGDEICPLEMYKRDSSLGARKGWRAAFMSLIDGECRFDWHRLTAKQCLRILAKVA